MMVAVAAVEEGVMFVVVGESVEKAGGSVAVRLVKIKFYYLNSWIIDRSTAY